MSVVKRWEEIELAGQTIREVGVLVGVFIPVDALFQSPPLASRFIVIGVLAGLFLTSVGIMFEARGRRRL